ncbi:sigma-70 family RNA polymerase sigma factor [Cytobacillus depressus]|uniref:Sigma-70 family RNA polymerase sigma factor n=1 Tax=Cytobacillus depressus TaxID=1602942 RepID=A0A6L3UXV7_9BACI|nr:sigma-70 family RNA polymerase sigma factor [Cytobacillus depressus]KAB2328952.1 sigma-70 family RNA polymerase sigma factor [Cytobacillus depressus]
MSNENFKKIERHLKNYRNYKIGIQNMNKQLDHMFPKITSSYEMAEGSTGTFSCHSNTEEYAIKRLEKKVEMEEFIHTYEVVIDSIDSAIKQLDPLEKEFVEKRYIENGNMKMVAISLGYSLRATYKIKEDVKNKFLITLNNLTLIDV